MTTHLPSPLDLEPSAESQLHLARTLALAGLTPREKLEALEACGVGFETALGLVWGVGADSEASPNLPWLPLREALAALQSGRITVREACRHLEASGLHPLSLWASGHLAERKKWTRFFHLPPDALFAEPPWDHAGLALHRALDLRELPPGFKTPGLRLEHCPRLACLGEGLEAPGGIQLLHCGLLEALEGCPGTTRFLEIRHGSSFKTLSPELLPLERLDLENLPSLRSLVLHPSFSGTLKVLEASALADLRLPGRKCRSLRLEGVGIQALPDGLTVSHDLILRDCPDLRTLSNGARIGGSLVLHNLPRLESFGSQVSIEGNLILGCLPRELALPNDLQIGGQIVFHGAKDSHPVPLDWVSRVERVP